MWLRNDPAVVDRIDEVRAGSKRKRKQKEMKDDAKRQRKLTVRASTKREIIGVPFDELQLIRDDLSRIIWQP